MCKIAFTFLCTIFLAGACSGQTFTFSCVCDTIQGVNCDICIGSVKARSFNGLLIRRNGKAYKWIDEPYMVRKLTGNNVLYIEQIPNPDQITIALNQTPFFTVNGMIDSTMCGCNASGTTYIEGPGINISGDTISCVDTSFTNEGILGVAVGTSFTSVITSNTSGANGVTLQAGTGIGLSESPATNGGTIEITNTGDLSNTNELQNLSLSGQALGISSGTGVTLPVVGISAGSGIGVSSSAGVFTISNTGGLPSGTTDQTLRHNGTDWVASSYLLNNASGIGINGSPVGGFPLYVNGPARFDGSAILRGAGTFTGTSNSPKFQLWNTTPTTGDTWYVGSTDAGEFDVQNSSGTSNLKITTAGQTQVANTLRIGSVSGITPTSIIGRNGSGDVGALTLGAGLNISAGQLTVTGGSGTVTSVAASAPVAGFTITGSPITTSGTLTFALNGDLQGLENLSGTGIAVRTGTSTWANRTLVAGSGITLTNADGVAGNITIASTGGSGTVTNSTSLVSGRVTLSSGTTSITDDGQFLYNPTTDQATIGTGTAVASLNIFPTATTGTVETVRESGSTSGNLVHTISNANNANTAANAFEQISVGGASAGDAFTQYTISGAVTTAIGVDNSDADKFKISPNSSTPGGTANAGIIVTTSGTPNVGINRDAPIVPLDVNGVARADQWRGPANVVSSANITFGTGAGTGPLNLSQSGYTNAFQIGFRTGTTPIANGDIFTFTYPTAFAGGVSFPVFSARTNAASATEITKFYISSAGATTFVLRANGTLSASTDYYLTFNVGGY